MRALGVFLLVLAIYALASPGRIDMIDGQYRFEVAKNIVTDRSVQIEDMFLGGAVPGVLGAYSPYSISGSLVGLPLILLAGITAPATVDRMQFFFSFTSAVLGAATMALLYVFYLYVGTRAATALKWMLVTAFSTLFFPMSTTVFDQAQHGFFLLAACFAAYAGARRDSLGLTAVGGLLFAFLLNFQETYVVMLPMVAIACFAGGLDTPQARRRAVERAAVFVLVGGMGLIFFAGFNQFRFGSLLFTGKGTNHPPSLGNPVIGFLGLTVSPGKSVFLYSPPVLIALAGLPALVRVHRVLAGAVIATCLVHAGLISSVSFYGGDWCWGPRYFATTLPLLALAFPFAPLVTPARRHVAAALIALGVAVQVLGLSLDHHRFFYARSLPAFFWARDRTFYFRQSALVARPGEIIDSIEHGVPPEVEAFRPGPHPLLLTYCVFGGWGHPELPPPLWMRRYAVFWLPRPWPLWMRWIPGEHRPVDTTTAEIVVGAIGIAGLLLMWAGRQPRQEPAA